ncbi:NAD(P)-dependent oxidoreductase [Solidesulfovibrio sp.]|uniref:NAD(P)-dependent oxidoreductase n=1 Tax=Solidesulfovibrio sp. TaxID=2910990 RepID=UPI002B21468D|nr:NAD(P)-dependent oxidoreductase [Solidesulfovibrio sp.]MEA4855479.1 NAD(P)-dependent oxidoreductase [Solidesulfovibrio sp.]
MATKIGFLGLGIMGTAMSRNCLKAGYDVMVWNRSKEPVAALAAAGARVAATPAEAAAYGEVVIVMLTGPEACQAVLFGPHGAAESLDPGKVVVNMSTISPAYARQAAAGVRATGADYLDAPVSGSKKPAEEGTLVILAGGEEATITAVEPVLLAMGKKVARCGEAGMGSTMKITVNVLLGALAEGLAETVRLGEALGISRDALLDVILAGPMANELYRLKAPMLRSDTYPPQFPAKHMAKDLRFAKEAAAAAGAVAPTLAVLTALYDKLVDTGLGDADFASVIKALA